MLINHLFHRQGRGILTNLAHLFSAIWFRHLKFKLFYAWLFRTVLAVNRKKKNWTLWECVRIFLELFIFSGKITDRPGFLFLGSTVYKVNILLALSTGDCVFNSQEKDCRGMRFLGKRQEAFVRLTLRKKFVHGEQIHKSDFHLLTNPLLRGTCSNGVQVAKRKALFHFISFPRTWGY